MDAPGGVARDLPPRGVMEESETADPSACSARNGADDSDGEAFEEHGLSHTVSAAVGEHHGDGCESGGGGAASSGAGAGVSTVKEDMRESADEQCDWRHSADGEVIGQEGAVAQGADAGEDERSAAQAEKGRENDGAATRRPQTRVVGGDGLTHSDPMLGMSFLFGEDEYRDWEEVEEEGMSEKPVNGCEEIAESEVREGSTVVDDEGDEEDGDNGAFVLRHSAGALLEAETLMCTGDHGEVNKEEKRSAEDGKGDQVIEVLVGEVTKLLRLALRCGSSRDRGRVLEVWTWQARYCARGAEGWQDLSSNIRVRVSHSVLDSLSTHRMMDRIHCRPVYYYAVLANALATRLDLAAEVLDLCSKLLQSTWIPPIFAALFYRWLLRERAGADRTAEQQRKQHMIFLQGANSLFWRDLEGNSRVYRELYHFLWHSMTNVRQAYLIKELDTCKDLLRLVSKFLFYYDDSISQLSPFLYNVTSALADPTSRATANVVDSSDSLLQPITAAEIVELVALASLHMVRCIRNERALIRYVHSCAMFGDLELSTTARLNLFKCLHSLTIPGAPRYPPRAVRQVARKSIDHCFPGGRFGRFLATVPFRMLRPMYGIRSVLHYFVAMLVWLWVWVLQMFRVRP